MKKLLFLSIFLCFTGVISFSQYIVKPTVSSAKADTSTVIPVKKSSESQSTPMTGANKPLLYEKSVTEKIVADEEEDFDEKELDELEASIAKAKATLGIKNVSTTSSKSISSKNKESVSRVEENKVIITAPTTTYDSPTLMLNGRIATESNKSKVEFRQTALTEEEKKFYNTGGLKVNDIDEIDSDSIYINPTVAPIFAGGIEAMKAFFAQNLKIPEVMKGQEIKGRVFVRFVIRKNGKVDKVHLVKGPNDECNSEAIRVIKIMPAWLPASDKGVAVSSYHVLPISFATAPPVKN